MPQTKITLSDLHNLYIKGRQESQGLTKAHAMPLDSLPHVASDNALALMRESIGRMIDAEVKEKKIDPMSVALNNIDVTQTRGFPEQFEQLKRAESTRSNNINLLTIATALVSPNISLLDKKGFDVVVNDENGSTLAIARIINRGNSLSKADTHRCYEIFKRAVETPNSAYFGCKAILVEKIPVRDGGASRFYPGMSEKDKPSDALLHRMGLQQFMTKFGLDKYGYLKGLILSCRCLVEFGKLEESYDMRPVFETLAQSITPLNKI